MPAVRCISELLEQRPELTLSHLPLKILAVEDDAVARAVLRKALRRLGHESIEAADGEAAWALLETEPVRVVVSDWMMPRILLGKLLLQLERRADAQPLLEAALRLAIDQRHEDPERELRALLADLK